MEKIRGKRFGETERERERESARSEEWGQRGCEIVLEHEKKLTVDREDRRVSREGHCGKIKRVNSKVQTPSFQNHHLWTH